MTQDAVSRRKNNVALTVTGIVLTAVGLVLAIIALVYGNSGTPGEGPAHGLAQAGLLIGGAFALGLGVLSILIGVAKRAGRPSANDVADSSPFDAES